MKLLYISTFMFSEFDGKTYGLPSCSQTFFGKYLDVFSEVRVLGEGVKSYLDKSSLVPIDDSRISVRIIKPNTSPKDFKNDSEVKAALTEEISGAEAILIKPASRRGMMAIKIAKKLNKPYMIEMTGDIHNALRQHPSRIKRMYAPILYRNIKKAIADCRYGLYVSQSYLQGQFPIKGKMCGCADVVLEKANDEILEKRLAKIEGLDKADRIDLALIGFYQGKMKGVDTAIRALSRLPQRFHLSILGNGTQENRDKWIEYGKEFGIVDRIHFPEPLPSSAAVLKWLDGMDIFVLPTRSEGFGRCVAEAMSRGCPCFATDICTMPELLQKECLHPLGDDAALAALILDFVENPDKLKDTAKVNFEHAKDYDVDVLRQRRNAFLEEFRDYCSTFCK